MPSPLAISVISPVYEAASIVETLVSQLMAQLQQLTPHFEIILVEDGSKDDSWEKIVEQCAKHPQVTGIKLSRNFGQHYAVTAGLQEATGEAIVIMDCDMQDDPKHIQTLYEQFKAGYQTVFTKRIGRKHAWHKGLTAWLYNRLFRLLADKKFDLNLGSMVMISKQVQTEFLRLKDKDRLYLQLLKWIGLKPTYVEVPHQKRFAGKSTYTFRRMFDIAISGLTSHSDKLLRLSVYSGILMSLAAFLGGLYVIITYFTHGYATGWPSLFVLILFATGVIQLSIGIAGLYIGKIFEQSKDRPLYVVEEKITSKTL